MWALIAIAAAIFASPVASPTPEQCAAIHALVGGDLVEWVGYPQGWNLPADLEKRAIVDFEDGGVWNYHSDSDDARYVWVFVSYEYSTDANGEHGGNHEFCGPYRIAD